MKTKTKDKWGKILIPDAFTGFAKDRASYLADYENSEKEQPIFQPSVPEPRFKMIMSWLCDLPRGSRVLDVGCRTGELLIPLSWVARYHLVGLDLMQRYVDICKQRGYEAYQGFAEDMPFDDDSFDGVNMSEVIEHVIDPGPVLDEIMRVLKPGGMATFSFPYGPWHLGIPATSEHTDHHVREINPEAFRPYGAQFETVELAYQVPWAGNHPIGQHLVRIFKKAKGDA